MKKPHLILIGLSMMAAIAGLRADIVVPGANGTDGPLVITANTEIDLSQAVTGTWDQDNTANAGKGVYDPAKWAVVFKFSSVTVNSGATVTFKNHPSRAPVVWLVNGNVTIAGTVSMNGQNGQLAPVLSEPGPGGFRGGLGSYLSVMNGGAGFGPGGGGQQGNAGGPGGYGSNGVHDTAAQRGFAYGNPSLIPLIGGSGGAGDPEFTNNLGGGAGGGAILIASQGLLTISGQIRTNGGNGLNEWSQNSGGGSGGGIRLIADTLSGSGALTAVGGTGWHISGLGRIRIERVTATLASSISPDPSVVPLTVGATAVLWPPTDAPKVAIVSVGGVNTPADPRAAFGALTPDVTLPQGTTTPVVIRTENVESASTVQVRITPRSNANQTTVNATIDSSATGLPPNVLQWVANVPTNVGYSALQVKVVRP
jgi:plastocyanin